MSDAFIYPERVNALNGESGSGKSWVAMLTAAQVIQAGGHIIYIDLEDHPDSIVARFRALGCSDPQIEAGLTYIRPDQRFNDRALDYLTELIALRNTSLVVIDSIGELMALEGCKPNDDDAVATLYRRIPRALARLGPAILLIDHVPKDNERSPLYGIGSQRKRAAIDGASYMVDQVKAFSADRPGRIRLTTAKDRNGNYAIGTVAAVIDVTPTPGDTLRIDVGSPAEAGPGGFRYTAVMEKVTRYLEWQPAKEANRTAIKEGIRSNSSTALTGALDTLVDERYVTKRTEGRADIYHLERLYSELEDLIGDNRDTTGTHGDKSPNT